MNRRVALTVGAAASMGALVLSSCAQPGPETTAPSSSSSTPSSSAPSTPTPATPTALAAPTAPATSLPEPTAEADTPKLPAGWRWESYGGVQVGVPSTFGWGNGNQRIGQWCVGQDDGDSRDPIVGRPGSSTLAGCGLDDAGPPRPETLIKNTGEVVDLAPRIEGKPGTTKEGDRTTVRFSDVEVTVQTKEPLRQQIVATIHQVTVDHNGCSMTNPISKKPSLRPSPGIDVASLTGVSSVSACKYTVQSMFTREREPKLISSMRVDGAAAAAAILGVAEAKPGGGPNDPKSCIEEVYYGDEIIVVQVKSAQGESQIFLRYSGCNHNGFDDGASVRKLNKKALAPFIGGPNAVMGGVSGVLGDMVFPE